MSEGATPFIDEMTGISPGLKAAYDDAMSFAAPDRAPVELLLLALGHRLADDVGTFDDTTKVRAFDAIEAGFANDDREVSAAAARVIEAAVGRAVDLGTWPEMRPMFRDRSAAHALTCMAFDR